MDKLKKFFGVVAVRNNFVSFLFLFVLLFSGTGHALEFVSSETEFELMSSQALSSLHKFMDELENHWTIAYDILKEGTDWKTPFVVAINDETGELKVLASPVPNLFPVETEQPKGGKWHTETIKIKSTYEQGTITMMANPGDIFTVEKEATKLYSTIYDLPLTQYIFGNRTFKTGSWIESVLSSDNDSRKETVQKFVDSLGGNTSKVDEILNGNSKIFSEFMMFELPLMFLTVAFIFQIVMFLYSFLMDGKPGVNPMVAFVRYMVFVLIITFYRNYIPFLIDLSTAASLAIVPEATMDYITTNLLSSTNYLEASGGFIAEWLSNFARHIGWIALQILFIARDVFLAITCIFGPFIFSISFPSSGSEEHGKSLEVGRQMLSGWIEAFTRLMLWGPIGASVVVLLGITTVLMGMGVTHPVEIMVMSVSMAFACTKVPDLAEKMSGQALTSAYVVLGGAITGLGGTAVGGGVSVAGSGISYLGTKLGALGAAGSIVKKGTTTGGRTMAQRVGATVSGAGNVVRTTSDAANAQNAQSAASASSSEGPHVQLENPNIVRRTPIT